MQVERVPRRHVRRSASPEMEPAPDDWGRAVAVVAHPDDLGYGLPAAIARASAQRKEVTYLLATSGRGGDRWPEALKEVGGIGWISALRSVQIEALVSSGDLQLSLFDQRNLVEISSPRFPGE